MCIVYAVLALIVLATIKGIYMWSIIFNTVLALITLLIIYSTERIVRWKNLKLSKGLDKGIDFVAYNGKRFTDESISLSILYKIDERLSCYVPFNRPMIVAYYHKAKNDTWLVQYSLIKCCKIISREYDIVGEIAVRKNLSANPEQFKLAFGEPVLVV